jgi:ABC-2 type transport system ATP-binding protein
VISVAVDGTRPDADGYVVETGGLSKRFGERIAVDSVDLRIRRGAAFGYLGPNGAGKTTLIRMLLGLTRPTAGSVRLLGRPMPQERTQALARVGAIVEEPRFHPFLTGRENLAIVAAAREREAHGRIDAALTRVGLAARADDRVAKYSTGMRQRLGVARCLLGDPELLLLDEPMNGLDPAGMEEFRELMAEFVAEGRTVVLSSHLLDEVEKTCDEVAIVDRGRIVVQGSVAELTRGSVQSLLLSTNDDRRARELVAADERVAHVEPRGDGLVVELRADRDVSLPPVAAELNRKLVLAGIAVCRLEHQHVSLERRFLELTSRLEHAA